MVALNLLLAEVETVDDLDTPALTEVPWNIQRSLIQTARNIPTPPPLLSAKEFLDSVCPRRAINVAPRKCSKTDLDSLASGLDKFKTSGIFSEILRDDIDNFTRDRFATLATSSGIPQLMDRKEFPARLKVIVANVRNILESPGPEERAGLSIEALEKIIDAKVDPCVKRFQNKIAKEVSIAPEDDPDLKGATNMRLHRERHALKSGLPQGGTTLYGNDPEVRLSAPDVDDDPNNFERLQAELADQGNAEENRAALARECEEADRAYHEGVGEVPEDSKGICEVPDPLSPRSQQAPDELKYDAAPDPEGNESRDLEANEAKYARASFKNGASSTPVDLSKIITPAQLEIFQTNRRLSIARYGSARRATFTEIAKESQKTPANVRQQIRRMRMNSDLKKIYDNVPNVEHVPCDDDEY